MFIHSDNINFLLIYSIKKQDIKVLILGNYYWSYFIYRMILDKIPSINVSVFVAKIKNHEKSPFLKYSSQLNIIMGERDDMNYILRNNDFDILLTAGFPWLIPVSFLYERDIPCFNIHPSILPSYWGPDPIRNQIIKEESHFGVSLHYLSNDFDSGEVISQNTLKNDNSMCINEILYRLGILIIPCFEKLLKRDFKILSKYQRNQTCNKLYARDYAPSIKSDIQLTRIEKNNFLKMQYRLVGTDSWKKKLYSGF